MGCIVKHEHQPSRCRSAAPMGRGIEPASGAQSVTLGGQTVIYNTTESLIKARNDLWAQLNAFQQPQSRHNRRLADAAQPRQ